MIITSIVLLLLAVAIFAGFTGVSKAMAKDEYAARSAPKVKRMRWLSLLLVLLWIILMVVSGFCIIDQTETAVVKTFGRISGSLGSGPHLVNPLTQTVTKYDLTVHVQNRELASYSKDAQPMTASVEFQYQLTPEAAVKVANQYGSYENLEIKLGQVVEERVKIVLSRYGAMSLLENRSSLSAQCQDEVRLLEDTFPVTFTSVVISDVDFSDAFEASVEAKMKAEQDALRAEQEARQAVIEANRDKEVAAIEAEAAIAQARGEAEAMNIVREALQNMPAAYIQQLYLEKWNGILPEIMTEGSNLMIAPNFQPAG